MNGQNEAIVNIFGSEYHIKTDVGLERIKYLAELIDKKMREIHKDMSLPSTTRIAVIACLNLLDEHLAKTEDLVEREKESRSRVRQLVDRLKVALEI